jgi:hypothetical protein
LYEEPTARKPKLFAKVEGHDLATCSFCWPVCFLIDFVLIVFILNRRRLFFSYVFFLQRPSLYLFSAPERRMSDGACSH